MRKPTPIPAATEIAEVPAAPLVTVSLVDLRKLMRRELHRTLTRFVRTQPGAKTFTPTDADMFSTAEAAVKLKRKEFTVREWCRMGRVIAHRLENGREWRISRKEIMRVQAEGLLPVDLTRNGEGESE